MQSKKREIERKRTEKPKSSSNTPHDIGISCGISICSTWFHWSVEKRTGKKIRQRTKCKVNDFSLNVFHLVEFFSDFVSTCSPGVSALNTIFMRSPFLFMCSNPVHFFKHSFNLFRICPFLIFCARRIKKLFNIEITSCIQYRNEMEIPNGLTAMIISLFALPLEIHVEPCYSVTMEERVFIELQTHTHTHKSWFVLYLANGLMVNKIV